MEEKTDIESAKDKIKLRDFVAENDRLIEVMGVFVALALFSSNVLQPFGSMLSFMLMSIVILVWMELIEQFPSKRGSRKLIWFENLISMSLAVFVLYFLFQYHQYAFIIVWFAFFSIMLFLFSLLIKRYVLFNRLFKTQSGQRRWLRFVTYTLVIVVALLVTGAATFYIGNPVLGFLKKGYEELSVSPPSPVYIVTITPTRTMTPTSFPTNTVTITTAPSIMPTETPTPTSVAK